MLKGFRDFALRGNLSAAEEAAPDTTAEPLSENTRLLTEIRDLLARQP